MVGPAVVRAVLAEHLPAVAARTIEPLGGGLDNVAFLVDGELVVRFAVRGDAERVVREARVLELVAERSPVPVPHPVFTAPERGCLAYALLPGVPLLDVPPAARAAHRPAVAAALGGLLAVLHAVPPAEVAPLVGVDDTAPGSWLREAARSWEAVAARVPMRHHRAVEALLLAAPPPEPSGDAVFSHNDLGAEHVLVDPATGAVTGVIDWADAAVTDPALDFGLVLRDLGADGLDVALARYPSGGADVPGLRERAAFYARCRLLEDLEYGIETGRRAYIAAAMEAMARLFPE
ncbi:phosphotransferase family protein [Pseudonocardia sichuanensis]|uniref:Aminoglycoside phosphotransferase (APT) family kinase protein n=1 Tax=Pseudonocardia kunmingensis TaxID=630975 RepID=A0A543DLE8_9PSEU|nr:phosphotransferase [Pseudonocardia kunmingensis]TQM10141.1 aminoglycoside phosphotransferase (APT) family kinase protein [Pseudonocardia kunmingensis]